jgi:hypothetical protein
LSRCLSLLQQYPPALGLLLLLVVLLHPSLPTASTSGLNWLKT